MRPFPLPLVLEDLSVNMVHLVHDSLVGGVSSTRKSANTCVLSVLHVSKYMSNSNYPTYHLVILYVKYGLNMTCLSG